MDRTLVKMNQSPGHFWDGADTKDIFRVSTVSRKKLAETGGETLRREIFKTYHLVLTRT